MHASLCRDREPPLRRRNCALPGAVVAGLPERVEVTAGSLCTPALAIGSAWESTASLTLIDSPGWADCLSPQRNPDAVSAQ